MKRETTTRYGDSTPADRCNSVPLAVREPTARPRDYANSKSIIGENKGVAYTRIDAREPIDGLYAVGCNGLGGQILFSHGLHIGWAMTSGRLVGKVLSRTTHMNANQSK